MPAVITCPTCSKEYKWKPELAGKRVKCKCGSVLTVPTAEPQPEAEDLYDLADDEPSHSAGHGIADLQAAAAAIPMAVDEGNQFRCPYCGENIEPGSAMCVFCGSALAGTAAAPAKRWPVPSAAQAAPPVAGRPVKMRPPSDEEQAGKTKLIAIGIIVVLVLVGAIYGMKQFAGKSPASDPNLKRSDVEMLAKIDEFDAKEAKEWLNVNPSHMLGTGWSKKQALYKVDEMYQMGAKKVVAFGAGISLTMGVELPDDPEKRKAIFDWQKKWHKELNERQWSDEGQKWLEITAAH